MKFLVSIALLGLAACRAAAPVALPALQWPAAPAAARVRLQSVVHNPEDLGARRGWFERFVAFVAGGDVNDEFTTPFAVAKRGSLLAVGDTVRGRVTLVDLSDGTTRVIDRLGGEPLSTPVGLALTDDGLWIADADLAWVGLVDLDGETRRVLRDLGRPGGLAVSPAGALAVALPAASQIAVVGRDGAVTRIGKRGEAPGEFNVPTQLAFGADGSLFVNDALNFRIQRFDAALNPAGAFGARGDAPGFFARSRGLAVDEAGHIYVADALFDVVQVFDAAGRLLLVIGGGGTGAGEFWMPAGVAYNDQTLVVADAENGRVQIFAAAGPVP